MNDFSVIILAFLFAASTPLSWSQQETASPRANTSNSPQNPLPTKGLVENGTYKNASIGLEFTPAENLKLREPEMKGTPGTTPLLITVEGVSDGGLISSLFSTQGLTTFYADALAYYPEEQRNVPRYLKKIIRANEADGWQHVDGKASEQMTGILFSRLDFVRGNVHEAVLVVTHSGYAFVFIFAGLDIGATNKLIAATKVKFIP
jgi:hypothetical protein